MVIVEVILWCAKQTTIPSNNIPTPQNMINAMSEAPSAEFPAIFTEYCNHSGFGPGSCLCALPSSTIWCHFHIFMRK